MNYNLVSQSEAIRETIVTFAGKKVTKAMSDNTAEVKQRWANWCYTLDFINHSRRNTLPNNTSVEDYIIPDALESLVLPESVVLFNKAGNPDLLVRATLQEETLIDGKVYKTELMEPQDFQVISSVLAQYTGGETKKISRSVLILGEVTEVKFCILVDEGSINYKHEGIPLVLKGFIRNMLNDFEIHNGVDYNEQVKKHFEYALTVKK